MTYTYDMSGGSDQDRVRLLIPDHDDETENVIFQDEEIQTFLTLGGGVLGATAFALETIASREALIQKVVRMGDVSTDGAKLAAELRARAQKYREIAVTVDVDEDNVSELFDWAEIVVDPWTYGERLRNEYLRSS